MAVSSAIAARVTHFMMSQYFAITATVRADKTKAKRIIANASPSEFKELPPVSLVPEYRGDSMTKYGPWSYFSERSSPFGSILGSDLKESDSASIFFCGILAIRYPEIRATNRSIIAEIGLI